MWIVIAIIWGLVASAVCIFTPVWESRRHIAKIARHLASCTAPPKAGAAGDEREEAFAETIKAAAAANGDAAH